MLNNQERTQPISPINQEQTKRPWITPTFERSELKAALSGYLAPSYDGTIGYSNGPFS